MATVSLTVSKTLTGSAVADSLTGGSSGYDFGESETGDDSPPQLAFFVRHDGTTYITNFALNVQAYSGTYGGDYNANSDLTKLIAHGDAGYGLQIDWRWDAVSLFSTYSTIATGYGDTFATRVQVPVQSMSRNNGGTEVDATVPVEGQVGEASNVALGDRAHMTMRYVTPLSETATGKRQFDVYYSFNYTN